MPDYPTPTHMDPAVWATYAAAHEQAEAAKYAADVAAQMAWDAAVLQVWVGGSIGFFAAIAALVAAGVTYRSAIKAAEHQTKLEMEKHEARVSAYAIRQQNLINLMIVDISKLKHNLITIANTIKPDSEPMRVLHDISDYLKIMDLPEDWNDGKWEEQSSLGRNYINNLIKVRTSYKDLNLSLMSTERIISDNVKIEGNYNYDYARYLKRNIEPLDHLNEILDDLLEGIPSQYKIPKPRENKF